MIVIGRGIASGQENPLCAPRNTPKFSVTTLLVVYWYGLPSVGTEHDVISDTFQLDACTI
mgnify:CR=1 FL=1